MTDEHADKIVKAINAASSTADVTSMCIFIAIMAVAIVVATHS